MRGLAEPGTLTGDLQRALTDKWKTQGQLVYDARLHSVRTSSVTGCLERLVREGRAESRRDCGNPLYMSGGVTEYRAPQALSKRGTPDGDSGNGVAAPPRSESTYKGEVDW